MARPQRYAIIIVGGGPAGLSAALHIAKQTPELASELLILEAAEHPRPKLCGGGITFHGEAQLKRLGITVDVPAFSVQNLRFQLGTQSFTTPCHNAMRIVQRAAFDAALADAVRQRNLCIHSNEKLLDIVYSDDGIGRNDRGNNSRSDNDISRDDRGRDEIILITNQARYAAKVVIAADGANSTVRRKLGIRSTRGVARLLRVVRPARGVEQATWAKQAAHFDFSCVSKGIQGYAWDFPCYINGQPHINHGIFDSRIDPAAAADNPHGHLKQVFTDYLQARDVAIAQMTVKGHPVRWFNPQAEFSRPHVLLAGDAAGVDPLFAEGISYAMEYGAVVAETVQDAFVRDDFAFTDYREQLLRQRLSRSLQRRSLIARHLYRFRYPWLWSWLWWAAAVAPSVVNQSIGAMLDVLPPVAWPRAREVDRQNEAQCIY